MNKTQYNNFAAFCEALAIHAEAMKGIADYWLMSVEGLDPLEALERHCFFKIQAALEMHNIYSPFYWKYIDKLAEHAIVAAGREGYPPEIWR